MYGKKGLSGEDYQVGKNGERVGRVRGSLTLEFNVKHKLMILQLLNVKMLKTG